MFIRIPWFDFCFELRRKEGADADTPGVPNPIETGSNGFRFLGTTFVKFECKFENHIVYGLAAFSKKVAFFAGYVS